MGTYRLWLPLWVLSCVLKHGRQATHFRLHNLPASGEDYVEVMRWLTGRLPVAAITMPPSCRLNVRNAVWASVA